MYKRQGDSRVNLLLKRAVVAVAVTCALCYALLGRNTSEAGLRGTEFVSLQQMQKDHEILVSLAANPKQAYVKNLDEKALDAEVKEALDTLSDLTGYSTKLMESYSTKALGEFEKTEKMLEGTVNLKGMTNSFGNIGMIFSSVRFITGVKEIENFFFDDDISNKKVEHNLKKLLEEEFNKMFLYMD